MEKETNRYEDDNAICCGLEISVILFPRQIDALGKSGNGKFFLTPDATFCGNIAFTQCIEIRLVE